MTLTDRVIVVTGAAAGMGLGYAQELLQRGARVIALDRDEVPLDFSGTSSFARKIDVTDEGPVAEVFAEIAATFGRLDGLVNNVGGVVPEARRPVVDTEVEVWEKVLQINARSCFLCCREALRIMEPQRSGKIVNIASSIALNGTATAHFANRAHSQVTYAAAKGAVLGLTRGLAREVGKYGICVNAVAPGLTLTESMAARMAGTGIPQAIVDRQCLPQVGRADDVVGLVLFLLSDEADFISGQCMAVDGGWTM